MISSEAEVVAADIRVLVKGLMARLADANRLNLYVEMEVKDGWSQKLHFDGANAKASIVCLGITRTEIL